MDQIRIVMLEQMLTRIYCFGPRAHIIAPISVHGEVDFVRFPFVGGFWLVFSPFFQSVSFYDCPTKEADHDGSLPDEVTSSLGNGLRPFIIVRE